MCGILLCEDERLADSGVAQLVRNRGGDLHGRLTRDGMVAVASVLSIRGVVGQPVAGDRYLLLYNGEIYNGEQSDTMSVARIVDSALAGLNEAEEAERDAIDTVYQQINRFENEMAIVLMVGENVYFFKDDIGRRSLGYSLDPFYVSSAGYSEEINPMAIYLYNRRTRRLQEWAKKGRAATRYMPMAGAIMARLGAEKYCEKYQYLKRHLACGQEGSGMPLEGVDIVVEGFCRALQRSVERRLSEGNICVFFSGGVDSVLVAVFLHRVADIRQTIYLINTSFGASSDREAGKKGFEELCLRFPERSFVFVANDVGVEEVKQAKEHIHRLIHPKSGHMDFNIGATLFFTARASRKYSKVAYLGSGADEMFGGYHRYRSDGFRAEMAVDLFTISHHNLCRDDRAVSDCQVECRFPFLDSELVDYSLAIADSMIMMNGETKFVIREALRRSGLGSVSATPKKAMQYGSGMSRIERRI